MLQALYNRQTCWNTQPKVFRDQVMSSQSLVQRFQKLHTLEGHLGCVNSILFSEDGSLAITGSDDTDIKLFDIHSGKVRASIATIHTNNIFWAKDVPHSNNEKLLSCAADGKVVLTYGDLDTGGGRLSRVLHTHRGRAHRLALFPSDPDQFYSCGEDGCLLGYDLRSDSAPRLLTTLRDQDSLRCSVYVLGVHPQRPHEVALGGGQARVQIFDARKVGGSRAEVLSELCPLHLRGAEALPVTVTGLQYNYSGEEVVLSYNDEDIYTMDPIRHNILTESSQVKSSCTSRQTLDSEKDKDDDDDDHEQQLHHLLQSSTAATNPREVSSPSSSPSSSPTSCNESPQNSDYIMKFSGHRNCQTVKQITYMGPRSEWVVTGSDCGHVFIWNAQSGKLVKLLYADSLGAVNCLSPHPFLPLLATSGLEDTAKLWAPGREASLVSFRRSLPRASSVGSNGSGYSTVNSSSVSESVEDEDDEESEDAALYALQVTEMNSTERQEEQDQSRHSSHYQLAMRMRAYIGMFQRDHDDDDDDDDGDDGDDVDDVDDIDYDYDCYGSGDDSLDSEPRDFLSRYVGQRRHHDSGSDSSGDSSDGDEEVDVNGSTTSVTSETDMTVTDTEVTSATTTVTEEKENTKEGRLDLIDRVRRVAAEMAMGNARNTHSSSSSRCSDRAQRRGNGDDDDDAVDDDEKDEAIASNIIEKKRKYKK